MNIDPTDDCSFWYTNKYYTSTRQVIGDLINILNDCTDLGRFNQTCIRSFTLPGCGQDKKRNMCGKGKGAAFSFTVKKYSQNEFEIFSQKFPVLHPPSLLPSAGYPKHPLSGTGIAKTVKTRSPNAKGTGIKREKSAKIPENLTP